MLTDKLYYNYNSTDFIRQARENMKNATDLFHSQGKNLRNSESFWSSLFAIQILMASSCKRQLHIPVHIYKENEEWWFQEIEPLVVPADLKFSEVVVEGNLRTGCHPFIDKPPHTNFENLKPDIMIIKDKTITIIETKTCGAGISSKESHYNDFCKWLREKGWKAETYLLLSAGHEKDKEIRMLSKEEWKGSTKLILWEMFFEAIEKHQEKPMISELIPDLKKYYSDKYYLKGNFKA